MRLISNSGHYFKILLLSFLMVLVISNKSYSNSNDLNMSTNNRDHFVENHEGNIVDLTVSYFGHNNPTIEELIKGKNKVSKIIRKIIDANVIEFKLNKIEVGIAPRDMKGGNVTTDDNKVLYVAVETPEDELEGELLNYFTFNAQLSSLWIFAREEQDMMSTSEEFNTGLNLVKNVILKYSTNNINLRFPIAYKISICKFGMTGGLIVEKNNVLFLSYFAEEKDLERFFMKYSR